MIRTALTALVLAAATALSAHADAERVQQLAAGIAAEAQSRAQAFQTNPAAPAEAPPPGDPLLSRLTEFALAAHTLSLEIEETGGPADLRCIFRGMSGDVEDRIADLDSAETRADMSRAYAEIARLARQAAQLAAEPDLEG
ncbi:MAG: hypothetical protein ACFE0P_00250 [Oceanicaulis sp.]